MPRRFLLSSEQRTRLFAIPVDHAEMTQHYVLNADDLGLVQAKRRAINRLGEAHPSAGKSENKARSWGRVT